MTKAARSFTPPREGSESNTPEGLRKQEANAGTLFHFDTLFGDMTSTSPMPTQNQAALLVRPYYIFGMVPRPTSDMEIPMPIRHSGSPSLLETALLIACGRIAEVGPDRGIFEIGTYKGQTCKTFALNFLDAKIRTLDLDTSPSNESLANCSNVQRLQGHTCSFDFTPYYRSSALVFVDGAHDEETVAADSAQAFEVLADGPSIIVWHDYCPEWRGVMNAVDKLIARGETPLGKFYRVDETSLAVFMRT